MCVCVCVLQFSGVCMYVYYCDCSHTGQPATLKPHVTLLGTSQRKLERCQAIYLQNIEQDSFQPVKYTFPNSSKTTNTSQLQTSKLFNNY